MDPRSGMTPWWSPRSVAANRPAFMGVDGYVPPEVSGILGVPDAPPPPIPGGAVPPEMAGIAEYAPEPYVPPAYNGAGIMAAPQFSPASPVNDALEAPPDDFGSDGGWFGGNPPLYADGSRHPAWGGPPRSGGGDGGGGGPSEQVTVPSTGASAGPNGVRPPRSEGLDVSAASAPSAGGSSGGGGGGDLYNALKSKLTGNLFGTGTTAEDTGPTQAQYRRSQKRSKQDWRAYEQYQRDRSTFADLAQNPYRALPEMYGGSMVPGARAVWDQLPIEQLSLLALGANKEDRYLGKRGSNRYVDDLQDIYRNLSGQDTGYSQDQLLENLLTATGPNTLLGRQFRSQATPEARYDKDGIYQGMKKQNKWENNSASSQASRFGDLFSGTYHTAAGEYADTMDSWMEDQLLNYMAAQNGKAAKNTDSVQKWMGKNVFGVRY